MPTPLEKLVRSDTAALLMLWAEGEAPGARCAGALQERRWKDKKEKKRRKDGKEKATQRKDSGEVVMRRRKEVRNVFCEQEKV